MTLNVDWSINGFTLLFAVFIFIFLIVRWISLHKNKTMQVAKEEINILSFYVKQWQHDKDKDKQELLDEISKLKSEIKLLKSRRSAIVFSFIITVIVLIAMSIKRNKKLNKEN